MTACSGSGDGSPSDACGAGTEWSPEDGLCVPTSADTGVVDGGAGSDVGGADGTCTPDCTGRCGGDDGCGSSCVDNCATTGQTCDPDTLVCVGECVPPSCADVGAECGQRADGCGGELSCGACGDDEYCSADNLCLDGECEPNCDGTTWGGPDGCGGECACGFGYEPQPDGTCTERFVDCIRIDRGTSEVEPPSGVRATFRVVDCDGIAIRPLDESRDVIRIINDETGDDFNASAEGGSRTALAAPSSFGLYATLTLDMSDSIVLGGDGVAGEVIDAAEAFIRETVERPAPGRRHQVSIHIFGAPDARETLIEFTDDVSALNGVLDELRARFDAPDAVGLGTTDLYGAHVAAVESLRVVPGDEALTERSVVLLTDGVHEAGDAEARRAIALDTMSDAIDTLGLHAFALYVSTDGCDALDPDVRTDLVELTSTPSFFRCADGADALGTVFTSLATTLEGIAASNYAVGVCTPVALGEPSMTVRVELDGVGGAPVASSEVTIPYSTSQLTGALDGCDPRYILDPCDGLECGPAHIGAGTCGTCDGDGTLCDEGLCLDPCAGTACGSFVVETSDGTEVEVACGPCESGACCEGAVGEAFSDLCAEAANTCVDVCATADGCYTEGTPRGDIIADSCGELCPCGETLCDGVCRDLESDRDACGGCGVSCEAPGQACVDGACICDGERDTLCGGRCVSLFDEDHCRACDNACPPGIRCERDGCACPAATPDICGDACVSTASDRNNCGSCGTICPVGSRCTAGVCACPDEGEIVCDGACVDVTTNRDNCGACGTSCATGCEDGVCLGGVVQMVGSTCAVLDTGELWCWGPASDPATDAPYRQRFWSSVVKFDGESDSGCALLEDGSVACRGSMVGSSGLRTVELGDAATDIGVGRGFACALLEDQTIWCWGDNAWGYLGDGTTDGRTTAAPVVGIDDAIRLAVGSEHVCALLEADGAITCWGYNNHRATAQPTGTFYDEPVSTGLTGFTNLVSGPFASYALDADGQVTYWGWRALGAASPPFEDLPPTVLEGVPGVSEIWANSSNSGLAVQYGDGSVDLYGVTLESIDEPGIAGAQAGSTFCYWTTDGEAFCWGDNRSGAVGDDTNTDRDAPVSPAW